MFYNKGGQALEQLPREVVNVLSQGQAEWGSELPDLVEDVAAHCRGIRVDNF